MLSREDLIALRERIAVHKAYPYGLAVLRGLGIYLCCLAISAAMMNAFHTSFPICAEFFPDPYVETVRIVMELILSVFLLNTVLLAVAPYDSVERKSFLAQAGDALDEQFLRRRLLRGSRFWPEMGVLWFCFAVFSPIMGWEGILLLIPGLSGLAFPLDRLLLTLFFAAVSGLLARFAKLEARRLWLEMPLRLSKNQIWKSRRDKERRVYSLWRLAGKLLGYALIYVIAMPILCYVLPVLKAIFSVVLLFSVEAWILIPILLLLFLVYFRALRARFKFVRRLKQFCRSGSAELLSMGHPYLSVFRDLKGNTFALRVRGKTYCCRMIAAVRRGNKLILSDDGSCIRRWAFHIPQPAFARSGSFIQVNNRGSGDDRELFGYERSFSYLFEGEGEKILLLNPVPRRAQKELQKHRTELDNGDRIGDYTVFTGNAFLRYLERINDR